MKLYLILIIAAMLLLWLWLREPDFDALIEANPTAAGEFQRPSYFRRMP